MIFGLAQQAVDSHLGVVELKQLKHFVVVAEEGGISAAARRLGLTQPALSRQIKSLEEDLGVVLLDRGARSFVLTAAAEVLFAEAKKLLDYCDAMSQRVRAAASGLPLRIGYSPSLASDFLPHAIERFTQLHPGVRVSLHDISTAEMQRLLLGGKLDMMVTVPCATSDAIQWTTLRTCGWRLAVSPRHRLSTMVVVSPGDLDGEKVLLYDREQYPDYWARVTGYFKAHKIQAKVAGEFDGISSLAAAVEANLGCAVLAESSRVVSAGEQRVVMLPLEPRPESLVISAGVVARDVLPHVQAFIAELKIQADLTNRVGD